FAFGYFPVFLVLLLVLFLVRIVFWSRMWGYHSGYGRPRRDPAAMTVRQRYARGEISREQYDQMMTELGHRRSGP
ncbi:MAG: SHOCT domain-containing protein, partial [Thermoplasmata archaeon]|nr:SHOCT domain-containing protein [Thermoplasmata archaeon]